MDANFTFNRSKLHESFNNWMIEYGCCIIIDNFEVRSLALDRRFKVRRFVWWHKSHDTSALKFLITLMTFYSAINFNRRGKQKKINSLIGGCEGRKLSEMRINISSLHDLVNRLIIFHRRGRLSIKVNWNKCFDSLAAFFCEFRKCCKILLAFPPQVEL